jgi:hypothetical protein
MIVEERWMPQKTPRVKLQSLLRDAFESLPDDVRGSRSSKVSSPVTVPVVRTSEDRSRMLQKVSEELARRHAPNKTVEGEDSTPHPAAPRSTGTLFDGILIKCASSDAGEDKTSCVTRATRSVKNDIRFLVAEVYSSMFRIAPEDHVIINPILNAEFIARCRLLGATTSEFLLNRTLLNLRKAGWNSGVYRQAMSAPSRDTLDKCIHATEMAASILQREYVSEGRPIPSVDYILCNPDARSRFDAFVRELFRDADCAVARFALLAFRKSGRALTQSIAQLALPHRTLFAPLRSLDPDDLPDLPGIYRIVSRRKSIFVAATLSLRARVLSHLAYGGTQLLPSGVPFGIDVPLSIEAYETPHQWQPRRIDACARAMRLSDHPPLNFGAMTTNAQWSFIFDRRHAV